MTTDYWSETKDMFINIIEELKIDEEYLKKPAPSYIFKILMETLKKTDFPKGLFSQKQQNYSYFKKHIEHKKKIFSKIIELINFILEKEGDEELNISIQDILKGKNPEITNKFLRYLYKFATNGKNYTDIIKEYIMKRNNEKYLYKNIEIPKTNQLKDKYCLFWIDKNSKKEESQKFLTELENNLQYIQLKNFQKICLNNLDDAFFILLGIKYKLVYIIISGEFYPEYYHKMKRYKNILKCIPTSVIYTTDELKKIYLNRHRNFLLTSDIYESINNSFYNYGGITSDLYSSLDFISNFYFSIKQKIFPKKEKDIEYKINIFFEKINSEIQLIFLFLFNEIMSEEKQIFDNELQYFKYILINRHGNDKFINLINPLLFIKGMPYELMIKFFILSYTEKSSFFKKINSSLNNKEGKEYLTFINLLLKGISNKYLSISEEDCLYRISKIKKDKIDKMIEQFSSLEKDKDESLPSFIIYSRCFLSFTKDKNRIIITSGDDNENYNIIYKLKNNNKINNKYSLNVDLEDISYFEEEKEVLFLPFNIFILSNIYKGYFNNEQCIIIELDYFGTYENILKKYDMEKIKEEYQNIFHNIFRNQKYINELFENNYLGDKEKDKKLKMNIFKKLSEKLKEKFGIIFNEEYREKNEEHKINENGENSENIQINYGEVVNIEEIIKFQYKEIESKESKVNEEQLNLKEVKNIDGKKNIIFFISDFKNDYVENIWTGKYNKFNEKEGEGKEYDLEDYLIFEGEYRNSKKIKGTEYYINGMKKYEGDYNSGERWDGVLYGLNVDNKYEIKQGNGFIKEFHENGCLYYEGEIRNGIKNGKGKIFNDSGHLIYEGNFINGMKNGDGKEYNENGDLIFEGDFINGNRGSGNIYKYNKQCELIYEKKFINGIYISTTKKSINDYKFDLMINDELFIMEDIHFDHGIEHDFEGKYQYEGVFKNGKKWNGKFKKYNCKKTLIIEGEYKEGKKYLKKYDELGNLILECEYENEFEYKGKQYKNGNLIFEGIYKNRKRYKGKEYDDKNKLIFDGTYKNEIRWNGILKLYTKDFKLLYDCKIKNGKIWEGICGKIDKGIGFEGIYKNGIKWEGYAIEPIRNKNLLPNYKILLDFKYKTIFDKFYKSKENKIVGSFSDGIGNNIKIFNNNYDLLSEANYFNGECVNGKEYNKFGEIIYEGEYKHNKKYNGIYKIKMNKQIYSYYFVNGKIVNKYIEPENEIIYEGEYNNNLREGKGKEYNIQGKILFKGEYKNGYRYNGKEFDENGKLIFNGQYMKGNPYKGIRKEYNGNILKYEYEIQNGLKLEENLYEENKKLIEEKSKDEEDNKFNEKNKYKNENLHKEKNKDKDQIISKGKNEKIYKFNGKIFNEKGELIFDSRYKKGKNPYKMKKKSKKLEQYLKVNKKDLIFDGEYKNGKKWNGIIIEINSNDLKKYEGKYKKNNKKLTHLSSFAQILMNHIDDTKAKPKKNITVIESKKKYIKNDEKNENINFQNSQIFEKSELINQEDIKINKESLDSKYYGINKDSENKYYLNDKLKYEKNIIDNSKYSYKEYDINGQIIFEGIYLNNQKYKGKEYNKYGNIIYDGEYKNGKRYNGNGYNNCSQFKYINGNIEGNIIVYDIKKHELFEGEYKNGEKYNGILKTYFDYSDFMLKREVRVKEGKIIGKGKEYYKNNKLKYIGEFKNDEFNGKGTLYHENLGYINYIGEFKNGKKSGLGKEFDQYGNIILNENSNMEHSN